MIDIPIIYEDKLAVAVNKPAGLAVHGDGIIIEPTLVDWLVKLYPNSRSVGEPGFGRHGQPVDRSGVVHRLDKNTSGVLIMAKTQTAWQHLKQQFQERQVSKLYHLIVYGQLKNKSGRIEASIGRHPKDPRQQLASREARGVKRLAVTDFQVLEQLNQYTLVAAKPLTGRRHQLRVHFKSLGYPIVGDKLYAPNRVFLPGLNRLALHASQLELIWPNGQPIKLEADWPSDFKAALENLRLA